MDDIDDLLIFSKDKECHHKHLKIVLSKLQEYALYASTTKFEFMQDRIDILVWPMGKNHIQINLEMVCDINSWQTTSALTSGQSFLGLL